MIPYQRFMIMSVSTPEIQGTKAEEYAWHELMGLLDDREIDYMHSIGYYKGEEERSVVISLDENTGEPEIVQWCKDFKQESVLAIAGDKAALVYVDGRVDFVEFLGTFQECLSLKDLEKHDSYTYVNGHYYICQ